MDDHVMPLIGRAVRDAKRGFQVEGDGLPGELHLKLEVGD
jgi:hypothetical protein